MRPSLLSGSEDVETIGLRVGDKALVTRPVKVVSSRHLGHVLLARRHLVGRALCAHNLAAISAMMTSLDDSELGLAQLTQWRTLIRNPLFLSDVDGTRDDRVLGWSRC